MKTPVVDYEKAAADTENIVHKEWGTNVGMHIPAFGLGYDAPELQAIFDVGRARDRADDPPAAARSNVPMETRGIIASWNPYDESLEVRVSRRTSSDYRAVFSRASSDVPEHKIHVVKKDVGGAFGQKGITSRDELCVVLATVLLGRPVKWIEDRRENLDRVERTRAIERADVQDGVRRRRSHPRDGDRLPRRHRRLPARRPDVDGRDDRHDGSRRRTGSRAVGFTSTTVFTNTCGRGAYRGPWQFETVAARDHARHRRPRAWASTRWSSAAATCSRTRRAAVHDVPPA